MPKPGTITVIHADGTRESLSYCHTDRIEIVTDLPAPWLLEPWNDGFTITYGSLNVCGLDTYHMDPEPEDEELRRYLQVTIDSGGDCPMTIARAPGWLEATILNYWTTIDDNESWMTLRCEVEDEVNPEF